MKDLYCHGFSSKNIKKNSNYQKFLNVLIVEWNDNETRIKSHILLSLCSLAFELDASFFHRVIFTDNYWVFLKSTLPQW